MNRPVAKKLGVKRIISVASIRKLTETLPDGKTGAAEAAPPRSTAQAPHCC